MHEPTKGLLIVFLVAGWICLLLSASSFRALSFMPISRAAASRHIWILEGLKTSYQELAGACAEVLEQSKENAPALPESQEIRQSVEESLRETATRLSEIQTTLHETEARASSLRGQTPEESRFGFILSYVGLGCLCGAAITLLAQL